MDAVEFVKEFGRMCRSYPGCCEECPLYGKECAIANNKDDPEALIEAVEKWAAEHPAKTRQSVFLELFPNAPVYKNTHNVALNPCLVDTTLQHGEHCPTGRDCCNICRREYWMQEVE